MEKILIVGYGSIGKRHLRIARKIYPAAKIAVLRNTKTKEIPEFADRIFNSINEAIEFSPQIAVICSPATEHINISNKFIKSKTNMLIEKPISDSTKGVSEFLIKARQNGVKVAVGYNLRFNKSLNKFKELIESGIIGDVLSVRVEIGQYLPNWRPGNDYRKCVSSQKKLGGGVLNELSHEIDYVRWIFGEIRSVQAEIEKVSDLEIDVEDTASLILKLERKKDNKPLIVSINMDFIRHDTSRNCQAIGSNGTLKWNAINGTVDYYQSNEQDIQNLFSETTPNDESYIEEWKSFIKNIVEDEAPESDGYSALSIVKIVEAARQSSILGKKILIQ